MKELLKNLVSSKYAMVIGTIALIWLLFSGKTIASSWCSVFDPQPSGITHSKYPNGLCFPAFNAYTDNNSTVFPDERYFFKVRPKEGDYTDYTDTLYVSPGDEIRFAGYAHNDADPIYNQNGSGQGVAHDVKVSANNFHNEAWYDYVTDFKTSFDINLTITSSNTTPLSINDGVRIVSSNGKPIRLKYISSSALFDPDDYSGQDSLSPSTFFGSGDNLGSPNLGTSDFWGCEPYRGYIYFEVTVEEEEEEALECESFELSPDDLEISDFFDGTGDPEEAVQMSIINVDQDEWDGSITWTGSNGGKVSTSCSGSGGSSSLTTDSTTDKVCFYAEKEEAKVKAESVDFSVCNDSVTVNGRCGDKHTWQDREECDDGKTGGSNDQCTDQCTLTYCGDKIIQTPNGEEEDGPADDGREDCDDGKTGGNNDQCTNQCIFTYCGDGIKQRPNGERTGGPSDNGYEDCDDGNSSNGDGCTNECVLEYCGDDVIQTKLGEECEPPNTASCDSSCQIIEEEPECTSLSLNETEVIAHTSTPLSVNVTATKPSYAPAIRWQSDDTGKFNGKNPYDSGTATSVVFDNGNIGEKIDVYDTKNPSICTDSTTVIGCESVSASPISITLNGEGDSQSITISPRPNSWDKKFIWASTDRNASFDGNPGPYTTSKKTLVYVGFASATITITDVYGNCSTSIPVTLETIPETFCGDGQVQSPNDEGMYEECEPPNTASCDSSCQIIEEEPECQNLSINNSEVIANTKTSLSVSITADPDFTPDLEWTSDETSGTFDGEPSPYFSEEKTTVEFDKGQIDDNVIVFDLSFPRECSDTIQVTGCKSVTVADREIEITDPTQDIPITLTITPSSWDKEFTWTSTDTTATFDGNSSPYTTNKKTIQYRGSQNATISIDDIYKNCSTTLTAVVPICGDGIKTDSEECDDANNTDGDGCNNSCKLEICGDGIIQTQLKEECDDKKTGGSSDQCTDQCTLTYCGDKIIQTPNGQGKDGPINDGKEQCDDEKTNGSNDACTDQCTLTYCGDKIIQTPNGTGTGGPKNDGNEACDDGTQGSGTCNPDCTTIPGGGGGPVCGNWAVESGEQCDDGNLVNEDGCSSSCTTEGDGGPGPGGGSSCKIGLKNQNEEFLYDGTTSPASIDITSIPLNFYVFEGSEGTDIYKSSRPYKITAYNQGADTKQAGIFKVFNQKTWDDTDLAERGNPLDNLDDEEKYFTIMQPESGDNATLENLVEGTIIEVDSDGGSCTAKLKLTTIITPEGEKEDCTDLNPSIESIHINQILPLKIEIRPEPTTSYHGNFIWDIDDGFDITFNSHNPPYQTDDLTVWMDGNLNPGDEAIITITSVDDSDLSTSCDTTIDIAGDIDALVKGPVCQDTHTNISTDGDTVEYKIIYYFDPDETYNQVTFTDTLGTFNPGNPYIPGIINGVPSQNDRIIYNNDFKAYLYDDSEPDESQKLKELPSCFTAPTDICYRGDIADSTGLKIDNVNHASIDKQKDSLVIKYSGVIQANSELQCLEDATKEECSQAEYFLNELRSKAEKVVGGTITTVSERVSYATVWAVCPYVLTRSSGDVFFGEPFEYGLDTSCVDLGVKNTTGLVVTTQTSNGGEGAEEKEKCETGDNLISRFSSFICELSTLVAEQWHRFGIKDDGSEQTAENATKESIEGRIQENIRRNTRYTENIAQTSITDLTIANLDTLYKNSYGYIPYSKIYQFEGDLNIGGSGTITLGGMGDEGARTILVKNGDLTILNNIEYAAYGSTNYKNIPSIAFIVISDDANKGNIFIDKEVTRIDGVLYTTKELQNSPAGTHSIQELTINGSVYGDLQPLFTKRKFVGDPEKDEAAVVIKYDVRILLNTPPGLEDYIKMYEKKVAR